ncbi:MFS transporter [bacterium]|nr:MFS transporter [bacterium]
MRKELFSAAVVVAALGYFVDVFDLLLFSILRVPSLKELGLNDAQILEQGIHILNLQLGGLIFGGIIWGILGDKFGRLSILFGSIFLYSIANIACAFVQNVETYALLRFIAGLGLAGELGAGITLVSELLSKEDRGWGTTLVTAVGVAGAIVAGLLAQVVSWRVCYFIGGVLGLLLLVARVSVSESEAFKAIKSKSQVKRGSILMLFSTWDRVKRYLLCILLGFPIMFVVYIFVTFSPEISKGLNITGAVSAGTGIVFCYIGITIGDFLFGALSQILKSRRRASLLSLLGLTVGLLILWLAPPRSTATIYIYCTCLGLLSANWAVLLTSAAEQFGTNLRATAATSIPNMVRGSAILSTLCFKDLKSYFSPFDSALIVGFASILIAFIALQFLEETYGKDLDFIEE